MLILTVRNLVTFLELNFSGISAIPRTSRHPNKSTLKAMARHIRKKNFSHVMSETKRIDFKTPEMINKNMDHLKQTNTAEILKNPQLDIQSNNSVIEQNERALDLSDILQTPDEDNSGFQNLLEDEILSNDLVSLSNNEIDQLNSLDPEKELEPTPNFPNKVQAKINPFNEKEFAEETVNLESKYLNMSLGDIPEEHEENATLSENNPSSLDKFLQNNSNTSSR